MIPSDENPVTRLLSTMKTVREKCPWDQKQTSQSLAPFVIEEAYELEHALQNQDVANIREELGDVLLQVVFQAQIQRELGHFNFYDVAENLTQKLVRRHPHVFGDDAAQNPEDVSAIWQRVKAAEKKQQAESPSASVLDQAKPASPLKHSVNLQREAARYGFDWPDANAVWNKVEEETAELKEALTSGDLTEIKNELGDVLFSLANLARKLDIDPDAALSGTHHKFKQRFRYIEEQLARAGKSPAEASLEEMDKLWEQAKSYDQI